MSHHYQVIGMYMQTHYHFAEHRRRLVNEIEKIAASDHVPELPQNPIFLSKQKSNNMSASGNYVHPLKLYVIAVHFHLETIRSMGKPPKPRTKAIPTSGKYYAMCKCSYNVIHYS